MADIGTADEEVEAKFRKTIKTYNVADEAKFANVPAGAIKALLRIIDSLRKQVPKKRKKKV